MGVKGSRVQAIVRELRGEKIDIITWTSDPRIFIAEALNPTSIEKVGIDEEKKSALVVVSDQQLSLAIGKNGQNVRLAAKLTGWKIDIIGLSEYEKEKLERAQAVGGAATTEETIVDDAATETPIDMTATNDGDATTTEAPVMTTPPPDSLIN